MIEVLWSDKTGKELINEIMDDDGNIRCRCHYDFRNYCYEYLDPKNIQVAIDNNFDQFQLFVYDYLSRGDRSFRNGDALEVF